MYSVFSQRGRPVYGIRKFVLDSQSDLGDLPIDIPVGCTAFIISNGKHYILNNEKEWVEFSGNEGGSGGGGDGCDCDSYGSIPFDEIDSYFDL